jgi:amiloride-sensitive sodium channel
LQFCFRIFWLTAFLLSSSVAAYFIYRIWYKWNTSPVLVTFSEVPTSVQNIPFPAITICSQVKVKKTAFNYSSISKKENFTDEE